MSYCRALFLLLLLLLKRRVWFAALFVRRAATLNVPE